MQLFHNPFSINTKTLLIQGKVEGPNKKATVFFHAIGQKTCC